jgi:hypothetical protein
MLANKSGACMRQYGGRRGDTAQALARWRHPVASSEAMDMLYRAMCPALYRCIAMAIEIDIDSPTFFVTVDSLLPTTIAINLIRDVSLFISMLLVYLYCLGARR